MMEAASRGGPLPDGAGREPAEAQRVDVAIIGGGPAGASAARLLAAWGWSVVVLTKADAGPALAESLPPSCRSVFEAVGVREAVEAAGFLTTGGNTVCWDGGPPRAARFAGGRVGWQVPRAAFDRLLRAEAVRAGAVVRSGVTVRRVVFAGGPRHDSGAPHAAGDVAAVVIGRDGGGRAVTVAARAVLDCSGRAGVLARRYRTRVPDAATTLALVGVWRRDRGWPSVAARPVGASRGPARAADDAARAPDEPAGAADDASGDDAQTVVEAYADGWAWSVPASRRLRYVTVMVDPRTTATDHPGALAARYRAELGKTTHLARLTAGAVLDRPPWARDASPYGARRFGGPGFLLVGDAATFVDPLSAFGVRKAMASAWLAAVAANTMLRHPARAALARRFHAEREREMWARARRQAAAFFADVSRRERHPFWRDRADPAAVEAAAAGAAGAEVVDALRRDPAVRAAFEALRRAPAIRLRPTGAARAATAPAVVAGCEVVPAAALTLDAGPAGLVPVRSLRGVDLPALLALAAGSTQVPDLYAVYGQAHPPVALADFLGALAVLIGRGLLRNDAA